MAKIITEPVGRIGSRWASFLSTLIGGTAACPFPDPRRWPVRCLLGGASLGPPRRRVRPRFWATPGLLQFGLHWGAWPVGRTRTVAGWSAGRRLDLRGPGSCRSRLATLVGGIDKNTGKRRLWPADPVSDAATSCWWEGGANAGIAALFGGGVGAEHAVT